MDQNLTQTFAAPQIAQLDGKLSQIEGQREQFVNKVAMHKPITFGSVGVLGVGILGGIFMSGSMPFWVVAGIGGLLGAIISGVMWNKAVTDFKHLYKTEVSTVVLNAINDSLKYFPKEKIKSEDYKASSLFDRTHNSYTGEDLITGKINAIGFRVSELETRYKSKNTNVKIFKGLFIVLDCPRKFEGFTRIQPKKAKSGIFKGLGKLLGLNKFEDISLNDPEFEAEFKVSSKDGQATHRLLSTEVRSSLLNIRLQAGMPLYVAITGSTVYAALETDRNLAEPSLKKPADDKEQLAAITQDFLHTLKITEMLALEFGMERF